MNYLDSQKRFMYVILLLVFIAFSCFYNVAYAKLTIKECEKKHIDLLASTLPDTGEDSNFNLAQYVIKLNVASYKTYLGIEALFQGECSHTTGAIDHVNEAKKRLQESSDSCQSNGQGSNCGVGPVVTQSPQNNIPVQTKQTISSDNQNDDPKVFGGGSSLRK